MRKITTVVLIIIFSAYLNSQTFYWDKLKEPSGGKVGPLFNIGDSICTLINTNLYFSIDNGLHWDCKNINENFDQIFRANDGSYLAISYLRGLFKSNDLQKWTQIYYPNMSRLAQDPQGVFYMIIRSNILISKDNCDTWNLSYSFNETEFPQNITFDKKYVYINCGRVLLRKGLDTTNNWQIKHLPVTIYNTNNISADTNGNVYISTPLKSFAYSSDYGDTWISKDISSFADGGVSISCNNNSVILNSYKLNGNNSSIPQIHISYDKGTTWELMQEGLPKAYLVKCLNNNFYSVVPGIGPFKLFRYSWIPAYSGISEANFLSFTKDNANTFWAIIGYRGIFKSTNPNISWERVYFNTSDDVNPVTFKRTTDGTLLAGFKNEIFRSSNNGTSWQKLNLPDEDFSSYTLYTDRFNRIFLFKNKCYLSTDKGDSWSIYYNAAMKGINAASLTNSIITSGNIYSTTNSGISWIPAIYTTFSKACSDDSGNVFVPVGNMAIARSSDYGLTWNYSYEYKKYGGELALDDKGNFYNYDPWFDVLLYSSDKGKTWKDIFNNMTRFVITDLYIDKDEIYAATAGGLWKVKKQITSIQNDQNEKMTPKSYVLMQNFPNPFNPFTTIRYSIPRSGMVKIILYDVLGNALRTLFVNESDAGTYNLEFDGTEFPSGVYFYRLISEGYAETKKMLLLK